MAREAGAKAREVEEAMEAAKREEEEKARIRAEELEKESKMTGVQGMSAFFKRQIEGQSDTTLTNEQRVSRNLYPCIALYLCIVCSTAVITVLHLGIPTAPMNDVHFVFGI